MSNLFNVKAIAAKSALVLALAAMSVGASAKQVSFTEMVNYRVAEQVHAMQSQQRQALEQSFYAMVETSIYNDFNVSGQRPVVSISDDSVTEEEEE